MFYTHTVLCVRILLPVPSTPCSARCDTITCLTHILFSLRALLVLFNHHSLCQNGITCSTHTQVVLCCNITTCSICTLFSVSGHNCLVYCTPFYVLGHYLIYPFYPHPVLCDRTLLPVLPTSILCQDITRGTHNLFSVLGLHYLLYPPPIICVRIALCVLPTSHFLYQDCITYSTHTLFSKSGHYYLLYPLPVLL